MLIAAIVVIVVLLAGLLLASYTAGQSKTDREIAETNLATARSESDNLRTALESQIAELVSSARAQNVSMRESHEATLAHVSDVHAMAMSDARHASEIALANLQGQVTAMQAKGDRYDFLMTGHTWHIGGKHSPHGGDALIKYECECGASVYGPEGYFNKGDV